MNAIAASAIPRNLEVMRRLIRTFASAISGTLAIAACGRTSLDAGEFETANGGAPGGGSDLSRGGAAPNTARGGAAANGGAPGKGGGPAGGAESGGAAGTVESGGAAGAESGGAAGEPASICGLSSAPDDGWVSTWGGVGYERAAALFLSGDALLVPGSFNGTTDFDPGSSVDERTASQRDLYLSVLYTSGDYAGTHIMGGEGLLAGIELLDAAQAGDQSLYLVTQFPGMLNMEVGTTGNELLGPNDLQYSVALIKRYADGSLAWGRAFPTHNFDAFPTVAAADGAVWVLGQFKGSTDFDPGPGSDVRDAGAGALLFLEALDVDGQHSFVVTPWREGCFAGPITVAADGSPWVAGTCAYSDSDGWGGMFVSKLDANGVLSFTVKWDFEGYPRTLTTGPDGALYLAGRTPAGDLDPGPGVEEHEINGIGRDAVLLKLAEDGTYQWSRTWGGPRDDSSWDDDELDGLTVDGCGSILVGGRSPFALDVDPGPAELSVPGGMYLSKFTTDGDLVWARNWAAPPTGYAYTRIMAVVSPGTDAIWLAGTFAGSVDFGLNGASDWRASAGQEDAFIMRLQASPSQSP